MRIATSISDTGQARAEVTWEDANRPAVNLSIECERDIYADPNGFLLACYLPAWHAGERRVSLDQAVCPILRANLSSAVQTLARWNRYLGPPPIIEAPREVRLPQGGVAMFLSGGVDSLASLRTNQLTLPKTHPEAISAAILVDYQKIQGVADSETDARYHERAHILRSVCADAGIEPILLRTNARSLNSSMDFWMRVYHGALLAGLAHSLSTRFRKVHIAATFDSANLGPWGSHPLLDPFYSTAHVQIGHHGLEMSRFAKTAIVADWPVALNNLNVCVSRRSDGKNCGRCEKCLRTMLALLGIGKLAECEAFEKGDLAAADLRGLVISNDYQLSCYRDVAASLKERGRVDLVKAIDRAIAAYANPFNRWRRSLRSIRV